MINFIINLTLFPGPTFHRHINNLDTTWSIILFNIVYSLGDALGKTVADIQGVFNKQSLTYTFFARFFFFFTVAFLAVGADKGDILTDNYFFPYFNTLLFAFTSGLCLSKYLLIKMHPSFWLSISVL